MDGVRMSVTEGIFALPDDVEADLRGAERDRDREREREAAMVDFFESDVSDTGHGMERRGASQRV